MLIQINYLLKATYKPKISYFNTVLFGSEDRLLPHLFIN